MNSKIVHSNQDSDSIFPSLKLVVHWAAQTDHHNKTNTCCITTPNVHQRLLFRFIKFLLTLSSNTMVVGHNCSMSLSSSGPNSAVVNAHGFATWNPTAVSWLTTKLVCRLTTFVNLARSTKRGPHGTRHNHDWLWWLESDVVVSGLDKLGHLLHGRRLLHHAGRLHLFVSHF